MNDWYILIYTNTVPFRRIPYNVFGYVHRSAFPLTPPTATLYHCTPSFESASYLVH